MRDARPWLQIVHIADARIADPSLWRERVVPHASPAFDATALPRFTTFLERLTHLDPGWRKVPTWLVDSGARTAFGDAASRQLANTWLRRWSSIVSESGFVSLTGERDEGPFRWPAPPLCHRTPDGRVELQLYAIGDGTPDSIARLSRAVAEFEPEAPRTAFRVLVSHGGITPSKVHMHLTLAARSATTGDLRDRVATESLTDPSGPQAFGVLRLHWSPTRHRAILVERRSAVRVNRLGPFGFAVEPAFEHVLEL